MENFPEFRESALESLKAAIAVLEQPATFKADVELAKKHVKHSFSVLYDMGVIAQKDSTPNPICRNDLS